MILVTGATGHVGKSALRFLLQRTDAANVAALVRNPAKVERHEGKAYNFSNAAAWSYGDIAGIGR
ncbi:NAD(P)H-binding protein [Chitinophaga sp.]|uniref:NAD(P)H-binding protein n=1 Tax=Chitinophaga sp. TaxID=1869181 RepID=UPI002605F2C4|nr:NAD(P)H-binding protein [uncultured Chitinophaga sp.]